MGSGIPAADVCAFILKPDDIAALLQSTDWDRGMPGDTGRYCGVKAKTTAETTAGHMLQLVGDNFFRTLHLQQYLRLCKQVMVQD